MNYRVRESGYVELHDWPPYRKALEKAYEILGIPKPEGSLPQHDWNIVTVAISEFLEAQKYSCVHCRKVLERHEEIRCLDCRAVLCPRCAEEHFWPNGRPKDDLPR
jgi:hypothetical protein